MADEQAKNDKKQPDVEFLLRERERFLRTLITNLPAAVFRSRVDVEFTKEFISDGCFDLTGFRAAELIGENAITTWNDLIYAEDRVRVLFELRRLVDGEQSFDGEQLHISYRIAARDASVKHIRERFRFVHDASGKINAVEGFINNITESVEAEELLRESENRYKLLAENMRDLVCLHDFDANYRYVSLSSELLLGYASEELIGVSIYELIHPEDVELVRDAAHARLLSGEISSIIEHRMRDKKANTAGLKRCGKPLKQRTEKSSNCKPFRAMLPHARRTKKNAKKRAAS